MTRFSKWVFIAVLSFQSFWFFYISQQHLIDADEGFYLLASRLVLQHQTPYLDFFYTQAPLMPYVYALWLRVAGISWFSARLFAALLTTILGGLVYEHVCHESRSTVAGASAAVLYVSSTMVFAWYPIAKTFSLAALFLFISYAVVARASASSEWMTGLAGALFGLSVDTRSYIVAVVPIFLYWIYCESSSRRAARLLWFTGGMVAGLVPSLALFLASPDAFLFNNLGYHALRSGNGLVGDWRNKWTIIQLLFFGRHTGVQFSLLAATSVVLLFFRRSRRQSAMFAFSIAFALGLISVLPTPTELQYFCMLLPFLIVAAVCSVNAFLRGLHSAAALRTAEIACSVAMLVFVASAFPTLRSYLRTGVNVPGIMEPRNVPGWTLPQVIAVSKNIDSLVPLEQQVASFWPGYVFASHADPYPGFENDFGMYVARFVTPDQRRKYHILTGEEMIDDFVEHLPQWAVVGNQGLYSGGPDPGAATAVLYDHGYVLVRTVGNAAIYRCCTAR